MSESIIVSLAHLFISVLLLKLEKEGKLFPLYEKGEQKTQCQQWFWQCREGSWKGQKETASLIAVVRGRARGNSRGVVNQQQEALTVRTDICW